MDKLKTIIILLSCFLQLVSCQDLKEKQMKEQLYEWTPAASTPIDSADRVMYIFMVQSNIKTAEGYPGGLPFAGSVKGWGKFATGPSRMKGTPTEAEAIYYALAEDKFYHLKTPLLPQDQMKDYMTRWYQRDDSDKYEGQYIRNLNDDNDLDYQRFTDLIFGFGPQGMVVLWAGYGPLRIELARYQAQEITGSTAEYEQRMRRVWASTRSEMREEHLIPDLTNEKWEKYRRRYNIKLDYISDNPKFRITKAYYECYNGEALLFFQPYIVKSAYNSRSLPNFIEMEWETDVGQKYKGRIFFKEKVLFDKFEKFTKDKPIDFVIRFNKENTKIEVLINNEPLEIQNFRIYDNNKKHKFKYD